MSQTAISRFRRLCVTTLVAVYFLILVGGVVRSTGSGMGCPDWPKCFGQWVPPTSVNQLPVNYKDEYAAYRDKKNQKFARYLSVIGLNETASKILNDKQILVEADFNATKTWVEYMNRVVGVIIGFLIILLFLASWPLRKTHRAIYLASLATLVLVIIQGWFGSIVVSTNLTAWTITVHMFLALVIVAILVGLNHASGNVTQIAASGLRPWLLALMVVLLVQTFLGTQVREALDRVSSLFPRDQWITQAGMEFIIHRTFSWLVLGLMVMLALKLQKTTVEKSLIRVPFLLILLSVLTGAGMAYLSVPAFLQPVHLLLAVVTFGWTLQVYLRLNTTRATVLNT